MIPNTFATQRLCVSNWLPEVTDRQSRRRLEAELAGILTPAVLAPLPPSMQLGVGAAGMATWIEARCAESDVLLVRERHDNQLIGLMILAASSDKEDMPALHVGYLFSESSWGRGFATELLNGFINSCSPGDALRLVAGVERTNPASARVLQKAGFGLVPELRSESADIYVREIC